MAASTLFLFALLFIAALASVHVPVPDKFHVELIIHHSDGNGQESFFEFDMDMAQRRHVSQFDNDAERTLVSGGREYATFVSEGSPHCQVQGTPFYYFSFPHNWKFSDYEFINGQYCAKLLSIHDPQRYSFYNLWVNNVTRAPVRFAWGPTMYADVLVYKPNYVKESNFEVPALCKSSPVMAKREKREINFFEHIFGQELPIPRFIHDDPFHVDWENDYTVEYQMDDQPLPASVDWTVGGRASIPYVRKMGECSMQYAIAAASVLETHYNLRAAAPFIFSASHLRDCDARQFGCRGGSLQASLGYVVGKLGGHAVLERDYPWTTKAHLCQPARPHEAGPAFRTVQVVQSEAQLQHAVATKGPVAAPMVLSQALLRYGGGLVVDPICTPSGAVNAIVVGYGTMPAGPDEGKPYWKVLLPWGLRYGVQGHAYVLRGNSTCGIGRAGFFADF